MDFQGIISVMSGLWIFDDCSTFETSDTVSHSEFLREKNMEKALKERSETLNWTNEEKESGYDEDLAYIAFKLGFLRITSYRKDYSVEFLVKPSKYQSEIIMEFVKGFDSVTFCKFMCEDMYTFTDEKSLVDYLY